MPPVEPLTEEQLVVYDQQLSDWDQKLQAYAADLNSHEKSRERALENRKNAEIEYDKLIVYLADGGLVLTLGFVERPYQGRQNHRRGLAAGLLDLLRAGLAGQSAFPRAYPNGLRCAAYRRTQLEKLDNQVNWANSIYILLVGLGIFAFLIFVFINFPARC